MSHEYRSIAGAFGKHGKLFGLAAVVTTVLLLLGNAAVSAGAPQGEAHGDRALRLLSLAPIPPTAANNAAGAMYSFDISFVDQTTQTYYLGDRSNAVVDVVDAKTGLFTEQIN